jgi:hypothetical protein
MSLWNTSVLEQIAITGTLLDPTGLRPKLLDTPLLAAMVPGLEHVHAQVLPLAPVRDDDAVLRELTTLGEEGNALDDEHDRLVRGIVNVLHGLAELAATSEEAEHHRDLLQRVLPTGLSMVRQSWVAEAGHALRLREALDTEPELVAALDRIPLPNGQTLLTVLRALVATGARLGAIEARRAELRQCLADATDGKSPTKNAVSSMSARKEWVDTVEAFRSVVRLPQNAVPGELRNAILSLIDEVERKADARVRSRTAARRANPATDPKSAVLGNVSEPREGASPSVPASSVPA